MSAGLLGLGLYTLQNLRPRSQTRLGYRPATRIGRYTGKVLGSFANAESREAKEQMSARARSSDDEEDPGDGGAAVRWDDDGNADFSHVRSFHAQQPACGMCGKPFEPSWHAQREELVVYGVVMLRGALYHSECIRAAPPPTMPFVPPPDRESRIA